MKLHSFGCSFVYGTDLHDQQIHKEPPAGYSQSTWPALIAKRLDLDYISHACPGVGNLQIMESVMKYASPDDIHVISWTWIDRFDFIDNTTESWQTLRPSLDHDHADFYYRQLHAQYRDMLTNLVYINTARDFLHSTGCKFIMTAMDNLLFEPVQKEWHDPSAVSYLQDSIRQDINYFDGLNFLDWSRKKGFDISDGLHPLEDAHQFAAEYFIDAIQRIA